MVSSAKTRKQSVRAASAKPAAPPPQRGSLVTALARQAQSFASSVLGNMGTATDVALSLAQSRIERPGPKAAVEKGAALLRDLRQAAGLTLDDLGRALEVDDPAVLSLMARRLGDRGPSFLSDLMQTYFEAWHLTPTEQDVASFTIKGCSIAEIARLRGSAEGTIKTHLNAIYRKSGVTGRAQLVSVLVEDLLQTPLIGSDTVPHRRAS